MYPRSKWHVYQNLKSSIKSTVAQPLNRQLCKRRIDDCASVESTVRLIILKKVLRFLDVPSVPR